MYILPVFATFDPNRSPETPTQEKFTYSRGEYEPVELKAQISFKTKVAQDLLDHQCRPVDGYTQQMHWQYITKMSLAHFVPMTICLSFSNLTRDCKSPPRWQT